jgi:hypothetical protein
VKRRAKRIQVRHGAAADRAWREDLTESLESARRVYARGRRPGALFFALSMLEDDEPMPGWLRRGCLDQFRRLILADPRTLKQERKDLERYIAVKLARRRGVKWKHDAVYEAAAADLNNQNNPAAAGADAVRLSYLRINKLFKGDSTIELSAIDPVDRCDMLPPN